MRIFSVLLAVGVSLVPVIFAASEEAPRLEDMSIGELHVRGLDDPAFVERVDAYMGAHGVDHPKRDPYLAGVDPVVAARAALHEDIVHGRTVAQWVSLARAEHLLARGDFPVADFTDAYLRLAAEARRPASADDAAAFAVSAAALSPETRVALAGFMDAAADTIASQRPIGEALAARRAIHGDGLGSAMREAERAANLDAALAILPVVNRLAEIVAQGPAIEERVVDPQGLIVFGTVGEDAYEGLDVPILLLEPAGDDRYEGLTAVACAAGPACFGESTTPLAIVLDQGGDDTYRSTNGQSQAVGSLGGIAILVDHAGDDHYSVAASYVLAQAGAEAGTAILLDVEGDDRYEITNVPIPDEYTAIYGQGTTTLGGNAIVSDAAGDDLWSSVGASRGAPGSQSHYVNGAAIAPGVAVFLDAGGGNDRYFASVSGDHPDYYSQGFGALGGLGIMVDEGGDDDYTAVETAYDARPLIMNCAFGTASYGGVGVFIETGGNDNYFGSTIAPRAALTMNEGYGGPGVATGIFIDVSGDDGHFMEAHAGEYAETMGRGVLVVTTDPGEWDPLGPGQLGAERQNIAGLYLDLGGRDAYTGAAPSGDGRAWVAGADIHAVFDPELG